MKSCLNISVGLSVIKFASWVYMLILPIMFLISCSDDTVEEMGGSNHVLLERYGSADFPGW